MKKVNPHLARAIIIAILFAALPLYTVLATPTSFQWGSFSSAGLTTFGVYDSDNVTILLTDDLAQLIWAGPDGTIDPPNPTDGSPTGDDQLLDTTIVQNASGPPLLQNKGYIFLKTYSYDTTNPQNNGVIYIRAWNADTPQTASAYGNSLTGTLTGGGTYNALRWNTNTTPTAVSLVGFQASAGNGSLVWVASGLALLALAGLGSYLLRRYRYAHV